jgi:hypothetical protein
MKKLVSLLAALALALIYGAAQAQQFKWVDKNGKTQYGDAPPAGVKATPLKGPATPPPPPAAKKDDKGDGKGDAKSAKKGPLTPAEQDAEFRKRRIEEDKQREQAAKKEQEKQARADNCVQSRSSLRALESGERISRTDEKGERYFLDDKQRAADVVRAQKSVQENC